MTAWKHEDVIRCIRESGKVPSRVAITSASRFTEDLNVDSLDLVGVLLDLQDMIGVEWSDEEISSMKSVGDVFATLARHDRTEAA